ncbi:hypothetical protein [Ammoniphilus sp. CFH 90114]|uniref:hypothetical protein n=1 Tax=Ammoniphilus sp. CFH 90114 TaxID=2493665 RepID=UPI00100E907E|nr:hypothetical protein [Ammoniphilus sp. CFH 90114]RXT03664.1 hypothetical protein EIZ39_23340 [Ammoniphilus sp. CFH 90114]
MLRGALKANPRNRITRISSDQRIEMINKEISASINVDKLFNGIEPLIVGENGVVLNFDHNNPQHKKWLND